MGMLDAAAPVSVVVNGPEDDVVDWDAVDWRVVEDDVRRLRQRIFTATQAGDWKKVRNLQKLMLRSRANAVVSVRRVTEVNVGRVTAVSQDQTENVWRALQPMIELSKLAADIPDTGITRIHLPGGGKIEPVTASARSRLGQRITCAVEDEAHDWNKINGGRKLADTQRRNLAGMGGRFLETGNAWNPSERSVAQDTFEKETGVFKLFMEPGPGSVRVPEERMRVLTTLYSGSWWVDPERISEEIDALIAKGDVAQAERFFMNRIVPEEDRAVDPRQWDKLARPDVVIEEKTLITVGVDGARYDDALAVIATDVASGFQWPLGIWERPQFAADDYEHPLAEVDACLEDAFDRYNVWRVYADPGSHTANISNLVERWQGKWGEKRVVAWLMSRPKPTATMVRKYVSAVHAGDSRTTETSVSHVTLRTHAGATSRRGMRTGSSCGLSRRSTLAPPRRSTRWPPRSCHGRRGATRSWTVR